MALSFQSRTVGEITVIKCSGRIIEGPESAALRQHVHDALLNTPAIILHLGDVHFVDSAGLGLLVRLLARAGQDNLKLCALPNRITEMLQITRLATAFECYPSEADAIDAFYREPAASGRPSQLVSADVLCVEQSADLLTYVQELLRHAGLNVIGTDKLPDAVTLLKAMRPKVVIVGSGLRSAGSSSALETFNRLVEGIELIDLPPDFGRRDPSQSGQQLVERVRVAI